MKKLNIYFTAGIPQLEDTADIIKTIQDSGADMIEIGMPYSDPVADGPVISQAHELALKNGMNIEKLFSQLKSIKDEIKIPVILMGYINPVLSFGFEKFCRECAESGVSGLIIPDLPPIEFEKNYQEILEEYHLNFTFLVTPETSDERILYLDSLSSGFLYAVSSSSTTGKDKSMDMQTGYFKRLKEMKLKNPVLIGFGIKDKSTFNAACEYASGAIIGTAYIKALESNGSIQSTTKAFINDVIGQ